jgi:hypothetical protein
LAIAAVPVWAKDKNIVTVLPFTLHSAENIEYVRQGIVDMLIARISVATKSRLSAKTACRMS